MVRSPLDLYQCFKLSSATQNGLLQSTEGEAHQLPGDGRHCVGHHRVLQEILHDEGGRVDNLAGPLQHEACRKIWFEFAGLSVTKVSQNSICLRENFTS